MSITLVTAACDRPEAWALCERWMTRQTRRWDQWLVLDDDAAHPTRCTLGQEYHLLPATTRDESLPNKLRHLFDRNLVRGDVLLFIENDDWYAPDYIETMSNALRHASVVGEGRAIYYHVKWRAWWQHQNLEHASLCATGITRTAFSAFHANVKKNPALPCADYPFWLTYTGSKRVFGAEERHLCIGMKCMPGCEGYVGHHKHRHHGPIDDAELVQLRRWIGEDAAAYAPFYEPEWAPPPPPPPPPPSYSVDSNGQMVGLGGE